MKNVCSIDGCTDYVVGGNLCNKHYKRNRKYGDPESVKKRARLNLVGQRFGKLTVLQKGKQVKYSKNGVQYATRRYWVCKCDCGNLTECAAPDLTRGDSKSCGCYVREAAEKRAKYGSSAQGHVLIEYKTSAKKRSLEFTLTPIEFFALTKQRCYYCDAPPAKEQLPQTKNKIGTKYVYNGIDRVDNTKGYVSDNVVPCCEWCNKMKHVHTRDEFIKKAIKIAKQWTPY